MATYPGQALPLPGPEDEARNKYKATGSWYSAAKYDADPLLCGNGGSWRIYCGQGNVFLPIPPSNQLGIRWPHIGTEKQDDWSEVTQRLVVEQVCGAIGNVFLHQYKRDEGKAEWGSLESRMAARAPSLCLLT